MKIGIMQPYFFPYFGYYQLINSVDIYVNLDHVSFMKRSYMVRNKIKNDTNINIPVLNGSQNISCKNTLIDIDEKYIDTFKKKLTHLYNKEKNYETIISEIFNDFNFLQSYKDSNISDINIFFIKNVCKYLNINTNIVDTSINLTNKKKADGLIDITNHYNGETYINAIGGQKLYTKDYFEKNKIELKFIKMGNVDFDNPYTSILDLLFRYEKQHIINELYKFELI